MLFALESEKLVPSQTAMNISSWQKSGTLEKNKQKEIKNDKEYGV